MGGTIAEPREFEEGRGGEGEGTTVCLEEVKWSGQGE